jgi:hypothetical protein
VTARFSDSNALGRTPTISNQFAALRPTQRRRFAGRSTDNKRSRPIRDLKVAKVRERINVDVVLVIERCR